jgi:hypothetical protein
MARKAKVLKPKKVKAPISRRTGIAAAPLDSWTAFKYYVHSDVDPKELAKIVRDWIRKNFKKESSFLLSGPTYAYTMFTHVAATIYWRDIDKEFPESWDPDRCLNRYMDQLRNWCSVKQAETADSDAQVLPSVSPAVRMQRKTNNFISEVEAIIDEFPETFESDFNMYNELTRIDAAFATAKSVYERYLPILEELRELVDKKSSDLLEGYGWMNITQRKKYKAFMEGIVSDAEKYMNKKRAVRQVKPRVRTADKQVAKLQYAKESKDYKIASINPVSIVGAQRVFVFNVKYRRLTEYVSNSANGFEIKGTTLQNINTEESNQLTLRKPEEILTVIQNGTPREIRQKINSLTTKPSKPNGRINTDTIIMRTFNK